MGCGCGVPVGALGDSLNTYEGPVPSGVPNPFTPMLHSYPTRYHGPIYTRPMNAFPWRERPNDFALEEGMQGMDGFLGPFAEEDPTFRLKPLGVVVLVGVAGAILYFATRKR